ncbi:NAD-dependent malic enzyme [Lacinutrix sp.]|uniref:NAD-dependent malic enzyme n=1 Tax=Lacinutrix sp. TaxID=1937692 RepID=UPI0025C4B0CE|nr:NAD-dependent malic enzyme [Lacinutrix sp.]
MNTKKRNFDVLHDGSLTKSVAFTREEREQLGLRGLLPYSVANQDMQVTRVMHGLRRKAYDIERYILLSALQDRNEKLFYKVVIDHIEEVMPLIYTPTVGQACKEFSHIFKRSKGFYITPEDKGEISKILDNWPEKDIRVIVITDGQRILGLGDLGANGMGIPIGKLALYTACAGIKPHQCLPVMLDVGTNNEDILNDVLYLGYPKKRLEGDAYFELVEEFVTTIQKKYPDALIQFEDFLTPNAYALLNKYKERVLCFNDDIQGTASVALAGVYASTRITNTDFKDLKIMFLGAGSAATGIADLMISAFMDAGLTKEEAAKHLWFVDINGLVVSGRDDLMEHNMPYAHDHEQLNFMDSIKSIKPHVLIGATGAPGTFTKAVIEEMAANNERPVVFALSNPTSRAECTAEQAYTWSNGKAIFASGSPFDNVTFNGTEFRPGQGNNAYVFPGIGLGAISCKAKIIPDELFLTAAKTLAQLVKQDDINSGSLYPKLTEIRKLSLEIAIAVADKAFELDLAQIDKPKDLRQFISDYMFDPQY